MKFVVVENFDLDGVTWREGQEVSFNQNSEIRNLIEQGKLKEVPDPGAPQAEQKG